MNWTEVVSWGGQAPYVAAAVAVCLGVMAAEVASLWSRSRAARRALGSALPFASGGAA